MLKIVSVVSTTLAFLLFLTGVPATAAPPVAAQTVKVSLLDMSSAAGSGMAQGMGPGMRQGMGSGMAAMSIRASKATVKAGRVRFDVTNFSTALKHEMVVVAVDDPNAPLPYDNDKARVVESKVKVMGEAEDMAPGGRKIIELTLPAGNYLLLCNLPGHYAAGMVVPFTVTP